MGHAGEASKVAVGLRFSGDERGVDYYLRVSISPMLCWRPRYAVAGPSYAASKSSADESK